MRKKLLGADFALSTSRDKSGQRKWSDKEKIPFGMANPLKFDIYVSRRHTVDLLESIME